MKKAQTSDDTYGYESGEKGSNAFIFSLWVAGLFGFKGNPGTVRNCSLPVSIYSSRSYNTKISLRNACFFLQHLILYSAFPPTL